MGGILISYPDVPPSHNILCLVKPTPDIMLLHFTWQCSRLRRWCRPEPRPRKDLTADMATPNPRRYTHICFTLHLSIALKLSASGGFCQNMFFNMNKHQLYSHMCLVTCQQPDQHSQSFPHLKHCRRECANWWHPWLNNLFTNWSQTENFPSATRYRLRMHFSLLDWRTNY